MNEESIVTIWEELTDDFFSLAESHLEAVWRLVERLDDDQLDPLDQRILDILDEE